RCGRGVRGRYMHTSCASSRRWEGVHDPSSAPSRTWHATIEHAVHLRCGGAQCASAPRCCPFVSPRGAAPHRALCPWSATTAPPGCRTGGSGTSGRAVAALRAHLRLAGHTLADHTPDDTPTICRTAPIPAARSRREVAYSGGVQAALPG